MIFAQQISGEVEHSALPLGWGSYRTFLSSLLVQ